MTYLSPNQQHQSTERLIEICDRSSCKITKTQTHNFSMAIPIPFTFCNSRQSDGRRRVGRPKRSWQDILKEDLEMMGVGWSDARETASDHARWR